jgi:hypothetical protein
MSPRSNYRKWLGWQDSNLRMPGSKPGALPLGDTPITLNVYPSPKSHIVRQLIKLD